jgi:hypothetical protein
MKKMITVAIRLVEKGQNERNEDPRHNGCTFQATHKLDGMEGVLLTEPIAKT